MYMHTYVHACIQQEKRWSIIESSFKRVFMGGLPDRVTSEPRLNEVRGKSLTEKSQGQAFQEEGTVNARP